MQIFTGNSIAPRGDMASRSLKLPLNVNRPDPENRDFAHPDPLAWTQANRSKILRALYTILIAGALSRPQHQEAKTRFKSWWSLVGWPVEYAASLVGITVNCTELLRAGEVEDEEASAVSAVLAIFLEIWGDKNFTAKDVVKVMTPAEPKFGGFLEGAMVEMLKGLAPLPLPTHWVNWEANGWTAHCTQPRKAISEAASRSARVHRGWTQGCHLEEIHRAQ